MATFAARPMEPAERPAWDALWLASHRWLPQSPAVLEAACGAALAPWGVFESTRLVAALAFAREVKFGRTALRHAAPVSFQGVLTAPGIDRDEAMAAIARAVPGACARADAILGPGEVDARPFAWNGWSAAPHYNFVNRLDAPGGIEASLSPAARRQLRKARGAGLRAERGDGLGELERLRAATTARHSFADAVTWEGYQRLFALGAAAGTGVRSAVLLARSEDGAVHAGALLLADAHRTYYAMGASDPGLLGSGAPTLLHTDGSALLAAEGWPAVYDWCGANTPGVARFKEGFGPVLELLMRIEWASPAAALWRRLRA
ncbi:MAG: GNAT family N-acetyltransferase [Candidatus Sumerlaeia bacterium]|nr:GNAT family N-acetyltransferase [Candidatus Sumerlaeia bacterium]